MRQSLGHYNTLKGETVEQDGSSRAVRNEFARRLEARRIDKGWNQSELARRATDFLPKAMKGQKQGHKIGRDQISHYSRGISMPRPEYMLAIAKALGCEPKELVPAAGVPSTVSNPPSLSLADIGADRVFLRINRAVSSTTAMRIVGLLAKEDE